MKSFCLDQLYWLGCCHVSLLIQCIWSVSPHSRVWRHVLTQWLLDWLDAVVSLLLLSLTFGQPTEEAHLQNGRMFFLGCFCINTVSIPAPQKFQLHIFREDEGPPTKSLFFSLQPCPYISCSHLLHSLVAVVHAEANAPKAGWCHLENEHSEIRINQIHTL